MSEAFARNHAALMAQIPADVEEAIVTPHEHESGGHYPLWLVFMDSGDGPLICAIADSEDNARGLYMDVVGDARKRNAHDPEPHKCHVERVPVNHNFGTEMMKLFLDQVVAKISAGPSRVRQRTGHPYYRRDGD